MRHWFEGKTVAIIGNASSLLEKENGKLIDSADVVCRLNNGICASFNPRMQNKVGRKTTIWMFNLFNDYTKRTFNRLPREDFLKMQMNDTLDKSGFDFAYPREFYDELQQITNPQKPTTGLRAIDYVLRCDPLKIQIHGFDWKKTPTFYNRNANDDEHDYTKEKDYCKKLFASSSKILLF